MGTGLPAAAGEGEGEGGRAQETEQKEVASLAIRTIANTFTFQCHSESVNQRSFECNRKHGKTD